MTGTSHFVDAAGTIAFYAILLCPALLLHACGQHRRGNAALSIPCAFAIRWGVAASIGFFASLSARFPLRDSFLLEMDRAAGINVRSIVVLASHWTWLSVVYGCLPYLILAAVVIPVLTGEQEASHRFLLANVIVYLAAMPAFVLLPAIGPWTSYHFAASPDQKLCQAAIVAIRNGARPLALNVVFFPSFHVILAILSASALWPTKWLRVPAATIASLVTVSTLTTGWHYGIDVLGGIAFSWAALAAADAMLKRLYSRAVYNRAAEEAKLRAQADLACPRPARQLAASAAAPGRAALPFGGVRR